MLPITPEIITRIEAGETSLIAEIKSATVIVIPNLSSIAQLQEDIVTTIFIAATHHFQDPKAGEQLLFYTQDITGMSAEEAAKHAVPMIKEFCTIFPHYADKLLLKYTTTYLTKERRENAYKPFFRYIRALEKTFSQFDAPEVKFAFLVALADLVQADIVDKRDWELHRFKLSFSQLLTFLQNNVSCSEHVKMFDFMINHGELIRLYRSLADSQEINSADKIKFIEYLIVYQNIEHLSRDWLENFDVSFESIKDAVLLAELKGSPVVSAGAYNIDLLCQFSTNELFSIIKSRRGIESTLIDGGLADLDARKMGSWFKRIILALLKKFHEKFSACDTEQEMVANFSLEEIAIYGFLTHCLIAKEPESLRDMIFGTAPQGHRLIKNLHDPELVDIESVRVQLAELQQMLSYLGAAHPLSLAIVALNSVELSNLNARRIAGNILAWIFDSSINFVSNLRCKELIAAHSITHQNICLALINHTDPQQRVWLTDIYFNVCEEQSKLQCFHDLIKDKHAKMYLLALLLTKIATEKPEFKNIIIREILPAMRRACNDGKDLKILLDAINTMQQSNQLSSDQFLCVIKNVLAPHKLVVTDVLNMPDYALCLQQANTKVNVIVAANPDAIIIVPLQNNQQQSVLISLIQNGSRTRLMLDSNSQYAGLAATIHKFLAKPRTLHKSILDILMERKILQNQITRERGLWLGLIGLAKYQALADFYARLATSSIEEAVVDATINVLDLPNDKATKDGYQNNILSRYDSHALFAYSAGLKKLAKDESQYYLLFKVFLQQVVTPNAAEFYKHRYDIAANSHMQKIAKYSDILTRWRENYSLPLSELMQEFAVTESVTEEIDIRTFLYNKIVLHHHLPNDARFALLYEFLQASEIRADNKCYAHSRQIPIKQKIIDAMQQGANSFMAANTLICIHNLTELFNAASASMVEKSRMTQNIAASTSIVDFELKNDLSQLMHHYDMLLNPQVKTKNIDTCTVQFTDDYWSLFMAGTDVEGSCQRVNGNPDLNKCLISGYIMSPHVKLLAILGADNKICMRAIFRLCFNEQDLEPVVHMEQIYAATGYPDYLSQALFEFAKLCAIRLGCDVVTSEAKVPNAQPYQRSISVSYLRGAEYVDALHGVETKKYTIKDSYGLFSYQNYTQATVQQQADLRKPILWAKMPAVRPRRNSLPLDYSQKTIFKKRCNSF